MADQLNHHDSVDNDCGARAVVKLSFWQLAAAAMLAIGFGFAMNRAAGLAALLGGLISALANLFFAGRLLTSGHVSEQSTPEAKLHRFYRSETMKIIFTLSMFVICLVIVKVPVLPFIIAYLVCAWAINWVFLLTDL